MPHPVAFTQPQGKEEGVMRISKNTPPAQKGSLVVMEAVSGPASQTKVFLGLEPLLSLSPESSSASPYSYFGGIPET